MPDPILALTLKKLPSARIIQEYKQTDDRRLSELDVTEDGWCLGMCVQWIRYKRAKTAFWSWFKTPAGAAAVRFIMVSQAIRDKTGKADLDERAQFALKTFKTKLIFRSPAKKPPGSDVKAHSTALGALIGARAEAHSAAKADAFCLYMSYAPDGGHVVAVWLDGTEVSFLDPNRGEVAFDDMATFQSWLPLYFVASRVKKVGSYILEVYGPG